MASIAGASEKEERPEFMVIRELIDKLDVEQRDVPMTVDVEEGHVVVRRGDDVVTTKNTGNT